MYQVVGKPKPGRKTLLLKLVGLLVLCAMVTGEALTRSGYSCVHSCTKFNKFLNILDLAKFSTY
eukprot:SAG31_NODE_2220_length_6157_cov_4.078244_5_plen_64_part_00